jgi:hypothetical protein
MGVPWSVNLSHAIPARSRPPFPWLLLTAKSTTGAGDFSRVQSIQRVHTTGGIAPLQPCSSRNVQQTVRVPYAATYYFYRTTLRSYAVTGNM